VGEEMAGLAKGPSEQAEGPFQYTLAHLFIVTTLVAIILGIGRWTGSAAIVIQLSLILFGWLIWRFAHGHLGAVILSLLGSDILICGAISWAYDGSGDLFGIRFLFVAFGSVLMMAGVGVFSWRASLKHPHWRSQAGLAILVLVILVGWWAIVPAIGNVAIARRQTRETAANNAAMSKAVAQIESLRKRLGRVPDDSEVNGLLEEPLPCIRIDGYESQIEYKCIRLDEYQLSFWYWDPYFYCSSTPKKGWYRVPF
jgi:hypothetical protein